MPDKRYIRTILPLRLEWEPCYCLPDTSLFDNGNAPQPAVGDRIEVSFSGKKIIAVVAQTDAVPDIAEDRIQTLPSYSPVLKAVSREELRLWEFIAGYYCCTIGEVYKAAYPGSKTESEKIQANADEKAALMYAKTVDLWNRRIEKLKGRLASKEEKLAHAVKDSVIQSLQEAKSKILEELEDAGKRLAKLDRSLFSEAGKDDVMLQALPVYESDALASAVFSGKAVLLKSSDRTGHYIHLASECLRRGKSALILVPDTSLAKALQAELKDSFGPLLHVHSATSTAAQRRKIADRLRDCRPTLVLGTKPSIFLPFRELGLIIIDNEQSPFYKQSDSAPRYNGRDCALKLASIHKCPVVLGSSSPSLESVFNCRTGKYICFEDSAAGARGKFLLIDMSAERRKRGIEGFFSRKLLEALDGKGNVALVRGFEREEELELEARKLLNCNYKIFTLAKAQRSDLSEFDAVALMSVDAMFSADDFRADERVFQFLDSLRHSCREVIVQTRNAAHRVFSLIDPSPLLAERETFGMPPYTRLVDIGIAGTSVHERLVLDRRLGIAQRNEAIKKAAGKLSAGHKGRIVIDVDPI